MESRLISRQQSVCRTPDRLLVGECLQVSLCSERECETKAGLFESGMKLNQRYLPGRLVVILGQALQRLGIENRQATALYPVQPGEMQLAQ